MKTVARTPSLRPDDTMSMTKSERQYSITHSLVPSQIRIFTRLIVRPGPSHVPQRGDLRRRGAPPAALIFLEH